MNENGKEHKFNQARIRHETNKRKDATTMANMPNKTSFSKDLHSKIEKDRNIREKTITWQSSHRNNNKIKQKQETNHELRVRARKFDPERADLTGFVVNRD